MLACAIYCRSMIILGDRDIKTLLLDLAQQRAVEDVLSLAVKSLGTARDSALVRIWLVEPDTACKSFTAIQTLTSGKKTSPAGDGKASRLGGCTTAHG